MGEIGNSFSLLLLIKALPLIKTLLISSGLRGSARGGGVPLGIRFGV